MTQALKDERWDILDAEQATLMETFSEEQKAAVLRSGSGIHREIFAILGAESQKRYLDRYNLRKNWIINNAQTPEMAKQFAQTLFDNMFPSLKVERGITEESIGKVAQIYSRQLV